MFHQANVEVHITLQLEFKYNCCVSMSAKAKEESTSAGVDAYYMLASAEVKEIADACEKQASKRGGAKDGPSRGA